MEGLRTRLLMWRLFPESMRDDLENIYMLPFRFVGNRFQLALFNVSWLATRESVVLESSSSRGPCCLTEASQEHILHHHELPHVSAFSGRAGGEQETPSPDRSHTRRSPSALPVPPWPPWPPQPPQPLQSSKTSPAAAARGRPHRARLVPRHAGPVEDTTTMEHAAVLVRSPAPVPRDVRRDQPEHSPPLETERTTRSTARQENSAVTVRRDTAERAHHAVVRRLVLQCGDDQRPGARMAPPRGVRRPFQLQLGQAAPAWHALELQEACQLFERAPQP